MENRKVYVISDNPERDFLKGLTDQLHDADYGVEKISLDTINLEQCEEAKGVLLLDFSSDIDKKTDFLHTMQQKDITRDVTVIAILPTASQKKLAELLEHGAADVVIEEDGLAKAYTKLGQSIDSRLALEPTDLQFDEPEIPKSDHEVRVLVIEDDALLKNLLSTRLEQAAIDCQFSTTGEDALDLVKTYRPTVILLDIMLPGRDGLDLLEEIRSAGCTVPVIIFSNRDEQADRTRAEALGAEKYFVKAMTDLSFLVTTIEELSQ